MPTQHSIPPRRYRFAFGLGRTKQRALLMILAVVIVFTFALGYGPIMRGCDYDSLADPNNAGTVAGKPVTRKEFNTAQKDATIDIAVRMRLRLDNSPQLTRIVRHIARQRIGSLMKARDLGIVTGEKEAVDQLRGEFTDRSGAFSQPAFDGFLKQLDAAGFSYGQFLDYYRRSLTISKLEGILGSAAMIAPVEIALESGRLTDSVQLECVRVPEDAFDLDVRIDDNDAMNFFEAHSNLFLVPERISVKYVALPISDFVPGVAKVREDLAREYYSKRTDEFRDESGTAMPYDLVSTSVLRMVTARLAREYYESNLRDFVRIGSNDNEEIAIPFEEVETNIVAITEWNDASQIAEEKAMDFVLALVSGPEEEAGDFEGTAAAMGLGVSTSACFGRHESIEGLLDVPPTFVRDAFDLAEEADARNRFSNPIAGSNFVYVIGLVDRIPEHVSDFESVSNRVYSLAVENKRQELLMKKAEEVRQSLVKNAAGGQPLAQGAAQYGLPVTTTDVFSLISPSTNPCVTPALMDETSVRLAGEFTDPVRTTNGFVIGYVALRNPGEYGFDASFGAYLSQSIRQERSRRLFADWQTRLLKDDAPETEDDESSSGSSERPRPPAGPDLYDPP